MKSTRLIIPLLVTALMLVGCTQVSVLTFREMPTVIEPHDAVAIAVSGETTDFAADAEGCVSKALKAAFPTLRIISSDDFYRIALPEVEKSVRASTDISVLLKEPAFRERIAPLGLRYLVLIEGGTQQKGEPIIGVGGGPGPTVFGWSGKRQSSLWASILDLKKYQPAGHVSAEAIGKPWWTCVGLGPFCLPLGAAAFTESGACAKVGEGVVQFLKGEEIPAPLWIVLAPKLRPNSTKIGSGETLSLRVVDKKNDDFLGRQEAGGSKIRSSNSLETVVDQALRTGFTNLGFEVLDSPAISSPKLELTIDTFEYWLAYDAFVDAQLTVALYKGEQRLVEKIYKINNKFDKPSNSLDLAWIAEKINVTLSDLLYKVLTDEELLLMLRE
jgi:YajG family uncharacterized lipoprotein